MKLNHIQLNLVQIHYLKRYKLIEKTDTSLHINKFREFVKKDFIDIDKSQYKKILNIFWSAGYFISREQVMSVADNQ